MIDDFTRQRLDAVRAQALRDGVDLWEALDRARLLQTEPEIKQQWRQCLTLLAQNIDEQPIIAFTQMGGGQNTPLDATRGILAYLDIFEDIHAAQEGRDRDR